MKTAAVRVCIFLLAFGLGIATFSLYATYKRKLRQQQMAAMSPVLKAQNPYASVECKSSCAQSYEQPDGEVLTEGMGCYESPSAAQFHLSDALVVTTPIKAAPDVSGTLPEEQGRFMVAYPGSADGRRRFAVVHYAEGNCYYYVNAPSLAIAVEFEQRNSQIYQLYRQRLSNKSLEMTPR